jgi:tRNA (guanine37-N1)-methyltransferase
VHFDILTLFPNVFTPYLNESILGRAIEKGLLTVTLHQIRDFALDKHHTVDDLPYGGGAGMVMKAEPLFLAWEAAQKRLPEQAHTILLSPSGEPLSQGILQSLSVAQSGRIILVCGRYEGIDQRFIDQCVDQEVSLGDFVLSGGELPALALIDGIMRLLPGALGNQQSLETESFGGDGQDGLEYVHYTRPPVFGDKAVPEILLSGDHAKIAAWRRNNALERTRQRRPDLLLPNRKNPLNKAP